MRRVVKFIPLLLPLLTLAVLAVVFLSTMGHEDERLAGTNSANNQGLVVQIGGGSRVCQQSMAPRGAANARLFVAPIARTGPPLSMTLVAGGRTVASSHVAGGWTGGSVRFPFPRLSTTRLQGTICVRNEGRTPLRLGGLSTATPTSTEVNGVPEKAVVTVEFFRAGTSDWWSLLPTIAHRAGLLKGSLAGGWSFWFAAALVLLAGGVALAVALGGLRR